MVRVRCQFVKLWDLSGYSEKGNVQEAFLLKTSISGQIVSEKLAEICSDDFYHKNPSKFDLGLNVYNKVQYEVTGGE